MSCTENESGPFVVFFLPAVVGCLTILIARRWANSQVVSGSTTAVSRRRKIIKDPQIKRTLPPIATKMLPPGSKKPNGVTKKGSVTLEEDMNGAKRLHRTTRLSPSSLGNGTETKFHSDGPVPPKHIPFPSIPHDGELLFETMNFVFTLVAAGLQFLNLYRTMWWIPNSYNNQAMHFNLIDPHLLAFIVTILSRRFLLSVTLATLKTFMAPKLWPHVVIATRMFLLGAVLGALIWCSYFIALKYSLMKLFFLCYPAVVYVLLFGAQAAPLLQLSPAAAPPPYHSCSPEPRAVRAEVLAMRQDFNMRVKKILFNSVVGAYYTSFIPCCFAQPYLYYDKYRAAQQVAFVWGGLFGRYAAQLLPAAGRDAAHRAALHLGRWDPLPDGGELAAGAPEPWSPLRLYGAGARVAHGAGSFVAGARVAHGAGSFVAGARAAAAVPGCKQHERFYAVFKNPSTLMCTLLCLQLALILVQLCLLFSSSPWHNFLAIFLLLFINYYTMFKLMRDYLVAWKVYKAEHMIQDKNSNTVT